MTPSVSKSLVSALFGGAAAFLFAPILWPFAIYIEKGGIPELSVLLSGLLTVAGAALVGGLLLGLIVGFPLLLLFPRMGIRNPIFIVLAGAFSSAVVFSGFMSWPVSAWPLYAFFSIVGGLCGAVAVRQNAL